MLLLLCGKDVKADSCRPFMWPEKIVTEGHGEIGVPRGQGMYDQEKRSLIGEDDSERGLGVGAGRSGYRVTGREACMITGVDDQSMEADEGRDSQLRSCMSKVLTRQG